MCLPKILIRFSLGVLFSWIASGPVGAQTNASSPAPTGSLGYNLPPDNILSVMRAPSPPVPLVSPTYEHILLVSWQQYPSIARVAAPFLRLAGVRIEPKNHSKHDTPGGYGITRCATGFELVRVADGKQTPIPLPTGMCPGNPVWAADGKHFAFVNIASDSVQLWIGDASTGSVKEIPGVHLNPMLNEEMQWMPDQKTLLVKLVPKSNDSPPQELNGLGGPSIQETTGQKGQSSTYEARDTLGNSHDEDLFDYFALSQLAFVDSVTLSVTPFGKAANYASLDPAPDGHHILVTTIHKPYSYVVAYNRFPKEVEVWDTSDRSKVTVYTVASLPMADRVPIRGVPTGPRYFSWRSTHGQRA
jgi:dipeptidyl aminopeptidase/acylaminoacyl peptidase